MSFQWKGFRDISQLHYDILWEIQTFLYEMKPTYINHTHVKAHKISTECKSNQLVPMNNEADNKA